MGDARLADGRITHGVIEHRARLPYSLEEVEGAEHLLVALPAFVVDGSGAPPPDANLRRRLRNLRVHRLFLGSDPHFLIGPRNEWAGARTATVLIRREAERLGVPLERVIVVGSSFRATMGLVIGLHAGVGHILAGAGPVHMGTWGKRLIDKRADMPQVPMKKHGLGEKLLVDDPEQRRRLDALIPEAVAAARHPCHLFLYVSPRDPFHPEMEGLHAALEGHPTITSTLEVHDYGTHKDVGPPFFRRVRQVLKPMVGTTRRSPEELAASAGRDGPEA
ncbi:MAG TPA: hypothetical protein VF587_08950 [Solirubrobacteraceae bacterium]|jgi:hypothetical protein